MQRPAVGDALRGCDDVRQAGPAAFQSRRENAIVEEARRTISRLIEPHEQRGVSRQVDLLHVDVRRSDQVGEQGFDHKDDTFIPEETAAQKKRRFLAEPPPIYRTIYSSWNCFELQLHGQAREDVATEGVVHLRIRVAVAPGTNAGVDLRIFVEHVVDAQTHVRRVGDVPAAEQIEVALRAEVPIDTVGRCTFLRHAADVAVGQSDVNVPRRLPTHAEARAELRIRSSREAAGATTGMQAGEVELREARSTRIHDQLVQERAGQVERQAAHAADVEAGVVEVQVNAGSLETANVDVEVINVARADPELACRITM